MRWPEMLCLTNKGRRAPIDALNKRQLERGAQGLEGRDGFEFVVELFTTGHAKCPRGGGEVWIR